MINHKKNSSQSGNIFFMLFASVALIGAFTVGANNVMKGLVTSMSDVTRKTIAEEKMMAGSRLSIMASTSLLANAGDCDSDGRVEPLPYRDAGTGPHPTGGGWIPANIGATEKDPWGTNYGYCVWDSGAITVSNNNPGCGGNTALRLNGSPHVQHSTVAVISAGKDRAFQTSCVGYVDTTPADGNPDTPVIVRGGDDIVIDYTYEDAGGIGGEDLWKVKDTAPDTALIDKNIEVTGSGQFGGALNLMQSGLILPDDGATGACAAGTDQQLRINFTLSPPQLEICDYGGGTGLGWTAVSMAGGAAEYAPPADLVSRWKLDETTGTAIDDDYSTNNGTFSGNASVISTTGADGTALTFDGSNDHIEVPHHASLDVGAQVTISAWVKSSAVQGGWNVIAQQTDSAGGSSEAYALMTDPGGTDTYRFVTNTVANNEAALLASVGASSYLNEWTHVAGTYDGTTMRIYVNGTLSGSRAQNGVIKANTQAFTIGGGYNGGSVQERWAGDIDDVMLFDRALTAEEVMSMYRGTGGAFQSGEAAPNLGRGFLKSDEFLDCSTAQSGPPRIVSQTDNARSYRQMRMEGNYAYVAGYNHGLSAFRRNANGSLTYLANYNGAFTPTTPWTDGTYIYAGSVYDPLQAFTFDGTSFTKVAQIATNQNVTGNVVGDGQYLYLADGNNADVVAYSFNGTAFTELARYSLPSHDTKHVWTDGKYIYVSALSEGFVILTFDGTSFTKVGGVTGGWTYKTFGDGNYLYALRGNDIVAYTFDGITLTQVASFSTGVAWISQQAASTDGVNIFVGWNHDVYVLRFNGSSFRQIAKINRPSSSYSDLQDVYSDGSYIYTLYVDGPITTYSGFSCNASSAPSPALAMAVDQYRGKISAKSSLSCGIKEDGSAWCWGTDTSGGLGNGGASANSDLPSKLNSGDGFKQISVGVNYGCGLKNDGTIWCWGSDAGGVLGNGAVVVVDQQSPVLVGNSTDRWTQVSTGSATACGIKTDGTAWCWGSGTNYKLGDGGTSNQASPVAVTGGGTWVMLDAGGNTSCGIKTDGSAWCWGENNYGQTGNAGAAFNTTPKPLAEPGPWTYISSGEHHTCGVKADGSAWCWGRNNDSRLGIGIQDNGTYSVPVKVLDPGPWLTIEANGITQNYTCGIKMDGTAWCWGKEDSTQVFGNGSDSKEFSVPTLVKDPGPWAALSLGGSHTCGIKTDGSAWCWGTDTSGALGNGSVVVATQDSPYKVTAFPQKAPWQWKSNTVLEASGTSNIALGTNSIGYDGSSDTGGVANGLSFPSAGQNRLRFNPKSTYTPPSGMTSWIKFDEGAGAAANDSVGAYHGTLVNAPAWVDGKSGTALDFERNSNTRVNLPNNCGLGQNLSTLSMAVWINIESLPANNGTETQQIFGLGRNSDASDASRINLSMNAESEFSVAIRAPDSASSASTSVDSTITPFVRGKWYHVAATVDIANDLILIYVNGVRVPTTPPDNYTGTATDNTTSDNCVIGTEETGTTKDFDGVIDEFMFFNRILTPAEVQAIYEQTGSAIGSNLVLETLSATSSSQISLRAASAANTRSVGVDYTTASLDFGLNNAGVTNWMDVISPQMEILSSGNVGVGTSGTGPFRLNIEGGLKIGNDAGACTAAKNGTLRFVSGNPVPWNYCNGTNWVNF